MIVLAVGANGFKGAIVFQLGLIVSFPVFTITNLFPQILLRVPVNQTSVLVFHRFVSIPASKK